MLFKYCGIIGLLVNIPITICITVIPPLPSPPLPSPPLPSPLLSSPPLPPLPPSPPSLLTLPLSPPSLSPHPPSPSLSPHPPSLPHVPSPPPLPTLPPSRPHPLSPILPSPRFPPSNQFIVLSSLSKALVNLKGSATRNDFVNDIVNVRALDAIFAMVKSYRRR